MESLDVSGPSLDRFALIFQDGPPMARGGFEPPIDRFRADYPSRVDTFRATGITAYLKNGGRLEIAQQMAAHESARTTGLYDRRTDEISLDEVERIGI
jgi:hypothetical protein